ncbi:MAG TPA: hypothetical protein VHP33_39880 [Polyangiaceae bacterium]|nr:hypothetical protein [Polyangiaceae bacterium]
MGSTSCLCDRLYAGGVLLRVHGESQEPGKLVAVVDALLSPSDQTLDLAIGDRVGGSVLAELPCAPEREMGQLAGQELFVLYSPAGSGQHLNCPEFLGCADANCKGLADPELPMCWDMCQADSMEACADRREAALLDGVFGWVVPWGDQLAFGGGKTLSSADLVVVSDVNTCLERFPADPAPPCQDTQTIGCSLAQPAERPSWAWGGALLAFLGLAVGARRWGGRQAPSRAVR